LLELSPLQDFLCLSVGAENGPRETCGKGEHADMDEDGVYDKQLLGHVESVRRASRLIFGR
jgi:hypothetical protein